MFNHMRKRFCYSAHILVFIISLFPAHHVQAHTYSAETQRSPYVNELAPALIPAVSISCMLIAELHSFFGRLWRMREQDSLRPYAPPSPSALRSPTALVASSIKINNPRMGTIGNSSRATTAPSTSSSTPSHTPSSAAAPAAPSSTPSSATIPPAKKAKTTPQPERKAERKSKTDSRASTQSKTSTLSEAAAAIKTSSKSDTSSETKKAVTPIAASGPAKPLSQPAESTSHTAQPTQASKTASSPFKNDANATEPLNTQEKLKARGPKPEKTPSKNKSAIVFLAGDGDSSRHIHDPRINKNTPAVRASFRRNVTEAYEEFRYGKITREQLGDRLEQHQAFIRSTWPCEAAKKYPNAHSILFNGERVCGLNQEKFNEFIVTAANLPCKDAQNYPNGSSITVQKFGGKRVCDLTQKEFDEYTHRTPEDLARKAAARALDKQRADKKAAAIAAQAQQKANEAAKQAAEQQSRDAHQEKSKKSTGCGDTTPQNNPTPTGCGDTKVQDKPAVGCGDTTPVTQPVTGCGDSAPKVDKPAGCGDTTKAKSPQILTANIENAIETQIQNAPNNEVLTLTPDQLKQKYGNDFQGIGLEVIRKKNLKHIVNKHMPGNKGARPSRSSIFNANEDCVKIAIEAWKNGEYLPSGRAKEYDFGRVIGQDMQGNPTSRVRVALSDNYNGFSSVFPIPNKV